MILYTVSRDLISLWFCTQRHFCSSQITSNSHPTILCYPRIRSILNSGRINMFDRTYLPSFSLKTTSLNVLEVLFAAMVLFPAATSEDRTLVCFTALLGLQVACVVVLSYSRAPAPATVGFVGIFLRILCHVGARALKMTVVLAATMEGPAFTRGIIASKCPAPVPA